VIHDQPKQSSVDPWRAPQEEGRKSLFFLQSSPILPSGIVMSLRVTVEVPEDAAHLLGEQEGQIGREMVVAAVLRWFEEGRLSQGQAAAMLAMKRGDFFDLLYQHRVSPVQMSVEDLEEDFRRG
jgi:predicted HTH domain antitoxin